MHAKFQVCSSDQFLKTLNRQTNKKLLSFNIRAGLEGWLTNFLVRLKIFGDGG